LWVNIFQSRRISIVITNLTKNAHGQQVLFAYDTTKHDLLRDLG